MLAAKILVFAIAFVAFAAADDGVPVGVEPTNSTGKAAEIEDRIFGVGCVT